MNELEDDDARLPTLPFGSFSDMMKRLFMGSFMRMTAAFLIVCIVFFSPIFTEESNVPLPFLATHQPPPREVFVQSNGALLFCRVIGRGAPIVVLHGGPGLSQEYLLPHMDRLSEHNSMIFYDQRACGRSIAKICAGSICLDAFLEDLESIRKAFGYKKISVLGHSWGGFLAMQYAIHYPEVVEKLILVSSMPASSEEFSLCEKSWFRSMAPYQEEINALRGTQAFAQGDPETTTRYLKSIFCLYWWDIQKAEQLNWSMAPKAFLDGLKVEELLRKSLIDTAYNLHEELRKLNMPACILHGDSDPLFATTAQKIHESIGGSHCLIMPQCGHFPFIEAPELFFRALREFLEDNEEKHSLSVWGVNTTKNER